MGCDGLCRSCDANMDDVDVEQVSVAGDDVVVMVETSPAASDEADEADETVDDVVRIGVSVSSFLGSESRSLTPDSVSGKLRPERFMAPRGDRRGTSASVSAWR